MKKLTEAFQNENVQAAIVIGSVFFITGIAVLYAILN
jgi:hypothetical protein